MSPQAHVVNFEVSLASSFATCFMLVMDFKAVRPCRSVVKNLILRLESPFSFLLG